MPVLEADVDKGFSEGDPFALPALQSGYLLMQVMYVQLAEYLVHFMIEIPGA